MRVLAFDHFFDQDLDALGGRLERTDHLVTMPYQRLYYLARRSFPRGAFDGVRAAYEPQHARHWVRFTRKAKRFAEWMLIAHRPEVFVVPSDALFYLRPVIERFAAADVPTVVMQKETTISPMVMNEHSRDVGEVVPFMSAVMTVCSERQRQFWINAGTHPERVIVTGQPRFDIYATGRHKRDMSDRPTVLYLSYADSAYLPSDLGQEFDGSWMDLRRETELTLAGLAESGTALVTVKPHPQQLPQQDWLGDSVVRADRREDTRALILRSDLVVGFQTTAMLEAAASGRPVIYAAWGELLERAHDLLIPFDAMPGLAQVARSPHELRSLIEHPERLRPAGPAALKAVEEHVGPIDGRATERVIGILRAHASSRPADRQPWGAVARTALHQLTRPLIAAAAVLGARSRAPLVRSVLAGRRSALAQEASELREVVVRSIGRT